MRWRFLRITGLDQRMPVFTAGRAGAVLTLARTTMPGLSCTGRRSGAVVIPQCVGASPGPTDSEMPGASSALNHSASAFAVPCSPAARFCQSNERGGILHGFKRRTNARPRGWPRYATWPSPGPVSQGP